MKINGVQKEYVNSLSISEMLMQEGFHKERVSVSLYGQPRPEA